MRHPTKGQSEDDLSRLTGSSSTNSTPSHSDHDIENGGCNETCAIISSQALILRVNNNDNENTNNIKNHTNQHHKNLPSYIPEFIDPLEWQKSRKRKERLDSTSSTTNDRKLVRSNSEELITKADDCEVIRRVSSHEDFKKPTPLQDKSNNNNNNDVCITIPLKTIDEIDSTIIKTTKKPLIDNNNIINKDGGGNNNILIRLRLDTSPARSSHHRWAPSRSDESDCEHERRRSSERFCKSRAQPNRKTGVVKKSGSKYSSSRRSGDENSYKYDISNLKYERRGFVSKFKLEERNRKEEAADGEKIENSADLYDNNLIDLSHHRQVPETPPQTSKQENPKQIITDSSVEALPWDCSIQDHQTPVLCRRFAEFQYPTGSGDPNSNSLSTTEDQFNLNLDLNNDVAESNDHNEEEPIRSFRTFTKMEELKTRDVMPCLPPLGLTQTPDERLKYINKKLTALKKRITQLEENYEKKYGYRPSQVERFNDKQIKGVLSEITKLRKEKHELKADPMAALGLKVSGDMDSEKKVHKMQETLTEIDKKLKDKRTEFKRTDNLDIMTAEQLVQEKTAVQHSLLYFESLYGRPLNRIERDTARPLYDRYRIIKRMVTRSITISSSAIGASELPTIMEHEALSCENIPSTDMSISSPSETIIGGGGCTSSSSSSIFSNIIDSPTDNSGSTNLTDSAEPKNTNMFEENLHTLSIDELWKLLDKVRDEKKDLKKVIRDFESLFEEQNGRKMLKNDRKTIEETYGQYKEKKAKARLLQALIKKHMAK